MKQKKLTWKEKALEGLQQRIDKIVAKYEKEKIKAYGKKIYYSGTESKTPEGMSAYRASLKNNPINNKEKK